MLFMPWKLEDVDLLDGHATFGESYQTHLESIEPVQQTFASNSRQVNNAMDHLENIADLESAWDSVAPGAQAEDAECEVEGTEQVTDYDGVEVLAPGQQAWTERQPLSERFRTEQNSSVMSNEEYCRAVRNLTSKQLEAVKFNRGWLKRYVAAVNRGVPEPDPYFVFLSGSGGVGKSHVIRLIHSDCINLLRHCRRNGAECYDAGDVMVLLTAPTGTAAFNIGGLTLHSALLINDMQGGKLSAENLNSLRNCLGRLRVLVIDEVSMVGAQMISQIDRRLRQIKSSDKLFGGVCVLAVGDLYQLPPVKQKAVFAVPTSGMLALYGSPWLDNVRMIELTQNMRQKDTLFSEILGRVRIGAVSKNDEQILMGRVIAVPRGHAEYPHDVLHVFATNNNCDEHNRFCLERLQSRIYQLEAVDSKRDGHTSLIDVAGIAAKSNEKLALRQTLSLAVGSKVMLTSNVNVADGLSNGALGTVVDVVEVQNKVISIQVRFDNEQIGRSAKAENAYRNRYPACVDVRRQSINYNFGKGKTVVMTRCQFPLVLAFGCTIHKIQGATLDNIVVSMTSRFGAGQAYVAMSRVKTLAGLQFLNFNATKIHASREVVAEMERLRSVPVHGLSVDIQPITAPPGLQIAHLNVRSLRAHRDDVLANATIRACDIVALNETGLHDGQNFQLRNFPWRQSVTYTANKLQEEGSPRGGGVMIAVRNRESRLLHVCRVPGIEAVLIAIETATTEFCLCSIYRHPQSSRVQFRQTIADIVKHIPPNTPAVIVGDLNDDQSPPTAESWTAEALRLHGFVDQNLPFPTTDYGSTIDRLSCRDVVVSNTTVADCLFSDHDLLLFSVHI